MINLSLLEIRDYALITAILVAVYGVFALLRLLRLNRVRRDPWLPANLEEPRVGGPVVVTDLGTYQDAPSPQNPSPSPAAAAPVSNVLAEEVSASDFARELAQSSAGRELQKLRSEFVALRTDLASLAEDVRDLKAARNVSPAYGEAMTLAQQGELPAGIAAQCGISVGEAELVAALARGDSGFSGYANKIDRDALYPDASTAGGSHNGN